MTEEMKINRTAVLELADILKETGLTEIEYETKQGRIRVGRSVKESFVAPIAPSVSSAPSSIPQASSPQNTNIDPSQHLGTIKSPMVGTVYLTPEPGASAFVKVGDSVSVGQTLLIIESMKVMNPIKATKAGKVLKICVLDAVPVEFNEPLIVIE
jgi:acetyl-CoA carboxylase biotin carboxyl carrier protein